MNRLRRAWIDLHIGWHQGHAERAEVAAWHHREQETHWRAEYERRWPNPFRGRPRYEQPAEPSPWRDHTWWLL